MSSIESVLQLLLLLLTALPAHLRLSEVIKRSRRVQKRTVLNGRHVLGYSTNAIIRLKETSAVLMEVSTLQFLKSPVLIAMLGYCSKLFYCNDLGSRSICCPQELMPDECESHYGPASSTTSSGSSPTTVISKPSQHTTLSSETAALSTGAKAGIGVGVGAAVLIALGAWFVLRRRRLQPGTGSGAPYVDNKAELAATEPERNPKHGPDGGQGQPVFEVSGAEKPAEAGNEARHELEGEWHGFEAYNAIRHIKPNESEGR